MVVKVKSIFSSKPTQPKEPRKKIELQLGKIVKQFDIQVMRLESMVADPEISDSARYIGKQLLQQATRFNEIQLASINQTRLRSLPSSLISVHDFSLWVKHELSNLTEEMYYFSATLQH